MKHLLFALSLFLFSSSSLLAQHSCAHTEQRKKMQKEHPELIPAQEARRQFLENFTQNFTTNQSAQSFVNLLIPVVFHVVHDNGVENISDAQIHESIVQLNEDYAALNPELVDVHPNFTDLVANVGFEFRLAELDPNGEPTTGINRIQSELTYNGSDIALKQMIQWDPTMYLNIWVVYSSNGSNGSAFAYYPADVEGSGSIYDGIVSSYWAVGRTETAIWTHYKILTHEVGHWANLKHTWGDESYNQSLSGCSYDDAVEDTPNTIGNTGCELEAVSCETHDNVQNYMDYSNCSNMFTEGQKTRMVAALNSPVGGRNNLWTESNHSLVFIQEDFLPRIVYNSQSFNESDANNGYIDSYIEVELIDLAFASAGALVEGVDFTTNNIPAGTSISVEVSDATHAQIQMTGLVSNHAEVDGINNIELHFTVNPFEEVVYEEIYNPSKSNIGLTFMDPYEIVFVDLVDDAHNFFEGQRWKWFSMGSGGADWGMFHYDLINIKLETYGNGAICNSGTSNITPLILGVDVGPASEITNPGEWYPSQLDLSNPSYTEWNGQTAYAGVQFQKNGNNHYGWIRLRVSEDGEHYYALDMAYNEAPEMSILTGQVQEPVIAYSQTVFHEAVANDGSIESERVIDVFGSTWADFGLIDEGCGFSVSGIPTGLSAQLERITDSRLILSFIGNANAHNNSDDNNYMNLSFDESLINGSTEGMSLTQQISVDFNNHYEIEYVNISASENISIANPGNEWKWFTLGIGDADYGLWYVNDYFRLETYSKSGVCNAGTTDLAVLQAGDIISDLSNWEYYSELETQLVITSPDYSEWNGQTAYVGIKFTIAERFHYGWMQLEVSGAGDAVTLIDYAYNINPGEEIRAGQIFATYGCTDSLAINFNPNAIDDVGTCEYLQGCIDPLALNFNPDAVEDDGSCYYEDDVLGCTDSTALNFNVNATYDDGSCQYTNLSLNPVSIELCLGDEVLISWSGGNPNSAIYIGLINVNTNSAEGQITIVDNTGEYLWLVEEVIAGTGVVYRFYIQDYPWPPSSWSYGSDFTILDDCYDIVYGCTDSLAPNYDVDATINDGSCEFVSCACPEDVNGDGVLSVPDILVLLADFSCLSECSADINGDDATNVQDLLLLLAVFGTSC
ncbi:MAG: M43 family zinc metalloprotease [Flavobacteriales bacterium]|nr:M43 family zinc metalloprotease [Flavobacteriales bacterium]